MTLDLDRELRLLQRGLDELILRAPAVIHRNERGGTNDRDGYPTSSIGGGGSHQPFTVDSTSSTARAAEDRIEHGDDRTDDIARAARALHLHIDKAIQHLQSAVSQVALAEHLANPDGRHSNPPTDCLACTRTVACTSADPIRAGYCKQCSDAWYDWRKRELTGGRDPDRTRFERDRRQRLEQQKRIA